MFEWTREVWLLLDYRFCRRRWMVWWLGEWWIEAKKAKQRAERGLWKKWWDWRLRWRWRLVLAW